jgi:SpoVK/Ycf46/Vps4 family AAA+-type ATPase
MVDPITFLKYNTFTILAPRVRQPKKVDSLTEDDLLICTPMVLGFSFGSKRWGAFSLSDLMEVEWNVTAFDKLVLNPEHSKIILALVTAHSSGATYFDDIVQNKGKGLVGLLSGPPGVGKTLTAEAVAEATHRPLYMLSAGELGTDPEELDENLNLVLELSNRWNSVLLLDEADAFLHERHSRELQRNSLVSIFLRQLEYYQGIMILTTNRVHAIDSAFHSTYCDSSNRLVKFGLIIRFPGRIHFSIDYPELDKASRRKIWNTFISRPSWPIRRHRRTKTAKRA